MLERIEIIIISLRQLIVLLIFLLMMECLIEIIDLIYLRNKYTCLGIGISEHKIYDNWVVIDYASDIIPVNPEDGYITFESDEHEEIEQLKRFNTYEYRNSTLKRIGRNRKEEKKIRWFSCMVCWIPLKRNRKKPRLRMEEYKE